MPVCTGEHSSRQPCYGWDQTKVNRSYGGNPIRSNHPESLNFGWAPGAEETIRRNRQIAIGCVTHAGRRNAKGPHAVHELHRDPADPIVAATARLCPDPPSTCDSKILAPSGSNRSADGPGLPIIEKLAHAKAQRRKAHRSTSCGFLFLVSFQWHSWITVRFRRTGTHYGHSWLESKVDRMSSLRLTRRGSYLHSLLQD